MKKKYILYPGWIKSKNDGDWHYITSSQLIRLYKVNLAECIVDIFDHPEKLRGRNTDELIPLSPRYDGRYPLFEN